jgi:hypothetical protein
MFPFLKEKKVVIRFRFDGDRVTWKDLKIFDKISDKTVKHEELQLVAAHFMVDENDKYLPTPKAIDVLDNLNRKEIEGVLGQFVESLNEAAIPKANGNGSNLLSEAGPAETFPAGQER